MSPDREVKNIIKRTSHSKLCDTLTPRNTNLIALII